LADVERKVWLLMIGLFSEKNTAGWLVAVGREDAAGRVGLRIR
jgi:hypothetical protein